MNGIEKITARIETDMKAEVEAIRKDAETRAAAILDEYRARAKAEAEAAAASGREAAARQKERLESSAKMDAKKELLAAKQAVLDEAFEMAHKKLLSLPEGDYVELLAKLAAKASTTGREELIFNASDRERIGAKVVEKANARLTGTAALTLSEESREMEGGVMLRSGNIEVNCAFETQLRVLRNNMAAEIAAILFA